MTNSSSGIRSPSFFASGVNEDPDATHGGDATVASEVEGVMDGQRTDKLARGAHVLLQVWLPGMDSNHDSRLQRPLSYH